MLIDEPRIAKFLSELHLFGKLDEEQMQMVTGLMNQHLYHAGDTIYESGSEPGLFYVIYSGRVGITRSVEDEPDYITTLEAGDYFGQEALQGSEYRQTTAIAKEDSLLFELETDAISTLEKEIPQLDLRFEMLSRSFDLTWHSPRGWREPEEVIYYFARRHPFYLVLKLIGPAILGLTALLILFIGESMGSVVTPILVAGLLLSVTALWGIWNFIDYTNDYYVLTDRRVLYLERIILLYDSRTEAPLEAILSVNQRTSWYSRPLHFGDVTVKSFTGTVRFQGIAEPQEVQALIERLLLRARSRKSSEERRLIDRTLRTRLTPTPPPAPATAPSTPVEPEVEPGFLPRFLATVFHTRWEEKGVITYRKHWFVLLQRILAPSVILFVIFGLMVARIFNAYAIISLGSMLALLSLIGFIIFLWWLYEYLDWSNDVYVVTADQIIDVYKKPIGTETRKAAPIKNILSIEYQRLGFTGYILNFGTVYIKVGEATFDFEYVYNPSEVQRELFKRYNEFKYREKLANDQAEANRMADWIEGYHRLGGSTGPSIPPPPIGSIGP